MRVAYFDLECWDLKPQFGPLLAASVLDVETGKMKTLRQDTYIKKGLADDMTDDRQLCLDLRDLLETYHITVGYFSKGFDLTHLRSRLVVNGDRPLKVMLHGDPIWQYKGWRGLRPMSSSMKNVAKFLKLGEQKPDVLPEVWMKAKGGNKKAMDEVCDRCEADVRITREIQEKTIDLGYTMNIQRY